MPQLRKDLTIMMRCANETVHVCIHKSTELCCNKPSGLLLSVVFKHHNNAAQKGAMSLIVVLD